MSEMADVLGRRNFEMEFDDGREWDALPELVKLGWRKDAQATIDFLSAAGLGPVQEAQEVAWEAGKNAVWTFMSNQDPRRERPTNPYRTEASS